MSDQPKPGEHTPGPSVLEAWLKDFLCRGPDLLAEVESLRAENERLKGEVYSAREEGAGWSDKAIERKEDLASKDRAIMSLMDERNRFRADCESLRSQLAELREAANGIPVVLRLIALEKPPGHEQLTEMAELLRVALARAEEKS